VRRRFTDLIDADRGRTKSKSKEEAEGYGNWWRVTVICANAEFEYRIVSLWLVLRKLSEVAGSVILCLGRQWWVVGLHRSSQLILPKQRFPVSCFRLKPRPNFCRFFWFSEFGIWSSRWGERCRRRLCTKGGWWGMAGGRSGDRSSTWGTSCWSRGCSRITRGNHRIIRWFYLFFFSCGWNFSSSIGFFRGIPLLLLFFVWICFGCWSFHSRSYLLGYSMEKDREFAILLFHFYNFFMLPKFLFVFWFWFFIFYFVGGGPCVGEWMLLENLTRWTCFYSFVRSQLKHC